MVVGLGGPVSGWVGWSPGEWKRTVAGTAAELAAAVGEVEEDGRWRAGRRVVLVVFQLRNGDFGLIFFHFFKFDPLV